MFEDEVAEIDAMDLQPGDLCIIGPGPVSGMRYGKSINKSICLVVSVNNNIITIIKPSIGITQIPKGWVRKIEIED